MSEYPADHAPAMDASSGPREGSTVTVSLTPLAQHYLDQTRPWVRLMSIMTFVGAGLMLLAALMMLLVAVFGGFAGAKSAELGGLGSVVGGGLLALFYLALACVYIAPGLYLSRYAAAITRLKANSTAGGLEDALKHQKSFWRFAGIVTAISIALAVVVVGVILVAGVIGFMMAARK